MSAIACKVPSHEPFYAFSSAAIKDTHSQQEMNEQAQVSTYTFK